MVYLCYLVESVRRYLIRFNMAIKSHNLCIHTKHKGRMKSFPGHIFFVKRLISLNWLFRGAVLYKRAAMRFLLYSDFYQVIFLLGTILSKSS